jgi:hypothetical protein
MGRPRPTMRPTDSGGDEMGDDLFITIQVIDGSGYTSFGGHIAFSNDNYSINNIKSNSCLTLQINKPLE